MVADTIQHISKYSRHMPQMMETEFIDLVGYWCLRMLLDSKSPFSIFHRVYAWLLPQCGHGRTAGSWYFIMVIVEPPYIRSPVALFYLSACGLRLLRLVHDIRSPVGGFGVWRL